ncbi:MAG: radical SAM family heme chaperone HemW [Bacteroidetes bacterium]|nr:radical SAM family heme chaperone HemW [Bacteroidota bacterium]
MAGLYLHIPFCKQACYYCDFHFSTDSKYRIDLLKAMEKELSLQKDYLRGQVMGTVYLGGGTPSLLTFQELKHLLAAIHENFTITAGAEITLEANPDDLQPWKLEELKSLGINRLSIGIQTFDDRLLEFLHRAHKGDEAVQSVLDARRSGFDNISIDLIYGIPGLTNEYWKETIRKALALSPEHISAYALTIEERTVFGHQLKKGKFPMADEEIVAQQFEILMDEMDTAGYQHYEISNFCKPGRMAVHNSNYWKREHYLGIGPSAHSYRGDSRQFNVKNNAIYIRSIDQGALPFEKEILSREDQINDYILTSLRTSWGLNALTLLEEWNDDLWTRSSAQLHGLIDAGMIEFADPILRLTRKGKLLADKIAEDLMVVADRQTN